jgi:hypothetical protein
MSDANMIPGSLPPDFWLRNATAPATLLNHPGPTDAEGLARLDLRVTDGRIAALAPEEPRLKASTWTEARSGLASSMGMCI